MVRLTCVLLALAASSAAAQAPPAVRLVRPSYEGPLGWSAVEDALRVELRSMSSDLAEHGVAPARLVLDLSCGDASPVVAVTLVHVESGRSARDAVPLGADPRALAVALSELVRTRWPDLAAPPPTAPPPTAPPPIAAPPELEEAREEARRARDAAEASAREIAALEVRVEALDARLTTAEAPPPPHRARGVLIDGLAEVTAHPAASQASAGLRAALSIPVALPLRLGVELAGLGGWAPDPIGDVALGGVTGALALRLAHDAPEVMIEAGPRVEVGWIRAVGVPAPGAAGASLDAASVALVLDARVRLPLTDALHLAIGAELGASLTGVDARADDRRVTAQEGPRLGLALGLSGAP